MKSSTKVYLYTFLLFGLIQMVSNQTFATNSQDESPTRRQFSRYINVADKSWNLTVSKGTSAIVTLKKGQYDLSIYKKNGQTFFELNLRRPDYFYEITANNTDVQAKVAAREMMYNEDACISSSDAFKAIKNEELALKLEDLAYSDNFFGGTCKGLSDDAKSDLQRLMTSELAPSSSNLIKCLSSDSFAKESAKVSNLQKTANKLITRYVDEITKIENGQSELKIECAEGNIAKYDPKRPALIFPIRKSELVLDKCKTQPQVFAHEFLHHAGLSEQETKEIDGICSTKKNCLSKASVETTNKGSATTAAVQAVQKKESEAQQKAIVPILQAEIKTAEFIPVQDSDIQEITNPTSTGAYQASVDRVYNSMSSNMEKMAAPLNRAIASTVTTARAEKTKSTTTSERSISKTTIAGLRQPASAKANGNEEYVVEEILADKYNVPVSEVRAAAVAAGVAAPGSGNSQTVATRSARSPATAAPGANSEIAGGNAGPGGGQVATASTGGSSAGGGVPGRSVSGARANSRLPASTGGNTIGNDPLVEQLGQFNEVRGQRYRQIQERYDDPTFEPELKAKNIAIEYRRNNKTTIIGETSTSRTLFRDDGTVLKKISGAK